MAEIQEYVPELEQQGPVGGISPNIELAAAPGRALERLGSTVSGIGSQIESRQYQEDVADTYAHFADQRANWSQRVQTETQAGTLNPGQLLDEYDQTTGDFSDKLSTPQGRNYFTRQQARLRGQVQHWMATGSAQIAHANAMASWKAGADLTANSVYRDPLSFDDALGSGQEAVDQMVQSGQLPATKRGQAVQELGTQLAQSAVLGMADHDPSQAKQMLGSEKFDSYLTPEQKQSLLGQVRQIDYSKQVDQDRVTNLQNHQQEQRTKQWAKDNYENIANGQLPAGAVIDAVKNGTMSPEAGNQWLGTIHTFATRKNQTDPSVLSDITSRIFDPTSEKPITDISQVLPYVADGKISPQDLTKIGKMINQTPDGQANSLATKSLLQSAKSSIMFKNQITGQQDMLGLQKYSQFIRDFTQKRDDVVKDGGNPNDLLDPKSPLYFASPENMSKYQTSIQEQLSFQHQDRVTKALGLRPTGNNPNPEPAAAAKLPNETPQDYLNRVNKQRTTQSIQPPSSSPAPQPGPSAAAASPAANDDIGAFVQDLQKSFTPSAKDKAIDAKIEASIAAEKKRQQGIKDNSDAYERLNR